MTKKVGNLDEEFEAFLKESLSSADVSINSEGLSNELDNSDGYFIKNKLNKSFSSDADSTSGFQKKKMFLKSIKKSNQDEDKKLHKKTDEKMEETGHRGISGEDDDQHKEGNDTLEEKEDKEQFFKALEEGRNTPPDYSLLNKQLEDSNPLSTLPKLHQEENVAQREKQESYHDKFVAKPQPEERTSYNSDSSSERKSKILEAINKRNDLNGSIQSSPRDEADDVDKLINMTVDSFEDSSVLQESKSSFAHQKSQNAVIEKEGLTQNDTNFNLKYQDDEMKKPMEKSLSKTLPPNKVSSPVKYDHLVCEMQTQHDRERQQINRDYFELKSKYGSVLERNTSQNNQLSDEEDHLRNKMLEMEMELKHQEFLLKGYQRENEKLYQESKKAKEVIPSSDSYIQENQKLKMEIANLREELEEKKFGIYNQLMSEKVEKSRMENKSSSKIVELQSKLEIALTDNDHLHEEIYLLRTQFKENSKETKTVRSSVGDKNMTHKKNSLIPKMVSRDKVRDAKSNRSQTAEEPRSDSLVEYLENKVKRLEDELKKKDEETDRSLKLLQENFLDVKKQYQEHLNQLEEELELKQEESFAGFNICSDSNCRDKMNQLEHVIVKLKSELQSLKEMRLEVNKQHDAEAMKAKMEKLHQEASTLQTLVKENSDLKVQIASTKGKYGVDMEKLQSVYSAKQASAQNKIISQEASIKKLQEELRSSRSEVEKNGAISSSHKILEEKVLKLEIELKDARISQSPKMRHFEMMKTKIQEMEIRLLKRDQLLNNLLKSASNKNSLDDVYDLTFRDLESKHKDETDKWKKLVADKVCEIDQFRQKLDDILSFLKKLKFDKTDAFPGQTFSSTDNLKEFVYL